MEELDKLFQWRTLSGDPVVVGNTTVIPQTRVLTVELPFGGFVWNHPTGVVVKQGEEVERLPIVDVTRVIQLAMLGLSVFFGMVTVFISVFNWSRRK